MSRLGENVDRFPHQEVNLIGATKPIDFDSANDLISFVARVSSPQNQTNFQTGHKLLRYLVRNKHWSPFEMVHVVLEILTTRDIGRQILRHRSFAFQELCLSGDTLVTTERRNSGSKRVKISKLYKRYTSRADWNKSDCLVRIYDRTANCFVSSRIKEVFYRGKQPVYRLTLDNGKSITSTKNHRHLTTNGYKALGDLVVTDFVACNGVSTYQTHQWLSAAKRNAMETGTGLCGIAEMAGVSKHTIRKWLKINGLQFTKKEVASYTSPWNLGLAKEEQPGYGKFHTLEARQKIRKSSRKGNNSNLYRGSGKQSWRSYVAQWCHGYKTELLAAQDYKCPISGEDLTKSNGEVDHIIPVALRPDLAFSVKNLQIIHRDAHKAKTMKEIADLKKTVTFSKVKEISFIGEEDTYDLEVEHPDHNFIGNGIVTHNSQRYSDPTTYMGHVAREARLQDSKNRQNSVDLSDTEDDQKLNEEFVRRQNSMVSEALNTYSWAVNHGIAKEQARVILPEGLTMSRMYMAGSLRSWIHYCLLRGENGTQLEHQDIALKAWNILQKQFPFLGELGETDLIG